MAKAKLTRLEELIKARNETRRAKRRAKYWENINNNKTKENGKEKI
jgi:hypothetical protein